MKKTNNSRILLDLSSIAVYRTSSMHHIDLFLLKKNTLRVTKICINKPDLHVLHDNDDDT